MGLARSRLTGRAVLGHPTQSLNVCATTDPVRRAEGPVGCFDRKCFESSCLASRTEVVRASGEMSR